VLGWKKLGLEQSLGTRLVTYADDLVILCRRGSAEKALHHLRAIMSKLKLTVNEEKTRICRASSAEGSMRGGLKMRSAPGRSAAAEEAPLAACGAVAATPRPIGSCLCWAAGECRASRD